MSRPRYRPACGTALGGDTAAVGILDERSGDGGYDCCCASCGWSGDVYPDDEQGEGVTRRLDAVYGAERGEIGGLAGGMARMQAESVREEDGEPFGREDG